MILWRDIKGRVDACVVSLRAIVVFVNIGSLLRLFTSLAVRL